MKCLPALLALLTVLAGCTSHTAPVAAAATPVANDSRDVSVDGKTQKEIGIRTEPVESRDQGASINLVFLPTRRTHSTRRSRSPKKQALRLRSSSC
jgi:hypothetical protein